MARLLGDPELASELARAARKLIEQRYDWSVIAPNYLTLLSRLRRKR